MISKNPRILFVGPMLSRHEGHVPNPMEILCPRLMDAGFSCILVSSILNRYSRFLDIIKSTIMKRKNYDIVCLQIYSGRSFVVEDFVSCIALLLRKRLVYVLHGGNIPHFILKYPRWSKSVLQRAHVRIAPSDYLAKSIEKKGLTVRVIPNYFNTQVYDFRQRRKVKPRLLWMRTFHPVYNPEMAVRSFKIVQSQYPEAELTMAGEEKGSLQNIKRLVSDLGLDQNIKFTGFLDSSLKPKVFSAHDLFLNTNLIDNMPISVLEAAAFGLPVISTNVGGIPFLLKHEETGLLVPADSPDEMAAAIFRLLSDPELTEKISRNGRRLAEVSSWENVRPLWERSFEDAMNQNRDS